MLFSGQRIVLQPLADELLELSFDSLDGINKFDRQTLSELSKVLTLIKAAGPRGLVLTSRQKVFFAGGDIGEFVERFNLSDNDILIQIGEFNQLLLQLSNLPCPTLCALNGAALGGGMEIALACDYRLALAGIKLGFPEVSLGIMPGTGGSARLPRLVGIDTALQWICHGVIHSAEHALAEGVIDELVAASADDRPGSQQRLANRAKAALHKLCEQPQCWQQQRTEQRSAKPSCSAAALAQLHYQLEQRYKDRTLTARLKAAQTMQVSIGLDFAEALTAESAAVTELGKSADSQTLVQQFISST
jgi:3-hydroxyacyl-CoA dehydrogenase/enoyl-CoA hydratase/3-hydroxybutyryl-CoA epimerase/enoyl-CoA isomerase